MQLGDWKFRSAEWSALPQEEVVGGIGAALGFFLQCPYQSAVMQQSDKGGTWLDHCQFHPKIAKLIWSVSLAPIRSPKWSCHNQPTLIPRLVFCLAARLHPTSRSNAGAGPGFYAQVG